MYNESLIPVVTEYTYKVFKDYIRSVNLFRSKYRLVRLYAYFFANADAKNLGLCGYIKYFDYGNSPYDIRELVREDFTKCCCALGLSYAYPFCNEREYGIMMEEGTQHMCEKRIEFVRAVILKYEQNL